MKKTTMYIVMASLCLNFTTKAQVLQLKMSGKIVTKEGKPIPKATISVKGSELKTSTNDDGVFILLNAKFGNTIIISSTGFQTKEVNNIETSQIGTIVLSDDLKELQEVEILSTGYQNIPKERATGSFSQTNMDMYNGRVSPDIISRLEGITSGLVFNSPGLTGSKTPKISIRGRSTIYANDAPLIIVDNFPFDGDINSINPNDVENITVLKDASAASIWGVQAGNGVIVINTKKGKLNQALMINVNANITFGNKPNLYYDPNYLDATNYIELEKFLYKNGKYDQDIAQNNAANSTSTYTPLSKVILLLDRVQKSNGLFKESEADKEMELLKNEDLRRDLSKYLYRASMNQQYSLNLSGGNNKNSYFLSSGYDKKLQNTVNDSYERISLNFNDTFRPLQKLEISAGVYYTQTESATDNTASQLFTGAGYSTLSPYTRLGDNNGKALPILKQYSSFFAQSAQEKGFLNWQYLPLDELHNGSNTNKSRNNDIRINTGINYSFLDNFNIDIKYQYERSILLDKSLAKAESFFARNLINRYATLNDKGIVSQFNVPKGGILNNGNNLQNSNRFRSQLNFNRTVNKHQINAIGGYEITQVINEGNSFTLYGYNDDLATSGSVNGTSTFPLNPGGNSNGTIGGNGSASGKTDRFLSYFLNTAYTYSDKYTLSGSARTDASNFFGVNTNKKYVPLWSGGIAWNVNREGFYNLSWLPELKIRASYGSQGNLDKSITAITTFQYLSRAQFTNANYARVSNYGNPDLQWEKTKMVNLGIDFSTKSNVISGSIEYYTKRGIDLIGFTTLEPTSGLVDIKGNYAGTTGKGLDVLIKLKNLDRSVRWTTNFLFSYATDKVSSYSGTNITPSGLPGGSKTISPVVGKPVYGVYGFKWGGLDPNTGDPIGYDTKGVKSSNYGSLINPTSIEELRYFGNARPSIYGGVNNQISYKEFELSFNISYKLNYYFHRSGINYEALVKQGLGNKEYGVRWQQKGDELKTNVPSFTYPTNASRDAFYINSEALVEKGDHIRIQDINLSYELNKKVYRRLPFSRLQFYFYANNFGILWRKNSLGIDPDYPDGGIPNPKTFAFGIKTTL